ncbi:MAG: hypothetical protein HYU86_00105 [Chloroflexi bacterium]|nr:hypothetical protein [Chloroflexota bacterium]
MPRTPFAKYHRADEPAMRQMLVQARQAALSKALARVDILLTAAKGEEAALLTEKRREVERLLSKAKQAMRKT